MTRIPDRLSIDKSDRELYDHDTISGEILAGRTRKGAGSLTNNELMFSMKIDLQGNVVWRRTDSLVDADHWDIYYGHTLAQLDNGDFAQVALYAMYDSIDSVVNYFPLISKLFKRFFLITFIIFRQSKHINQTEKQVRQKRFTVTYHNLINIFLLYSQ